MDEGILRMGDAEKKINKLIRKNLTTTLKVSALLNGFIGFLFHNHNNFLNCRLSEIEETVKRATFNLFFSPNSWLIKRTPIHTHFNHQSVILSARLLLEDPVPFITQLTLFIVDFGGSKTTSDQDNLTDQLTTIRRWS